MPGYEYKMLMVTEISQAQKKLNDYAEEGFELEQFQVVHLQGLRTEFYLVLKKDPQ